MTPHLQVLFKRRADQVLADNLPVFHHDDAVGSPGDGRVVRDHQEGRPLALVKLLDEPHQVLAGPRVQVARGLICQHKRGIVRQGAGHRNSLALASGELIGEVIHAIAQSDQLQQFPGPLAPRCAAQATHHGNLHILSRRECGKQVVKLEDEADRTGAERVHIVQLGEVLSLNEDLARGGLIEGPDHVQEGAFSASARPHHRHEFARRHLEVNPVQRANLRTIAAIDARDVSDFDQPFTCVHHGPITSYGFHPESILQSA